MRVQLTVNAEKLKNTARLPFQLADPYAVVTISGGPLEGTELGRTETIQNTLNPTWTKILFADVDTAVFMPFRVSVYDDNDSRKDTLMAEANFEMTSVCQSPGNAQFEDVDGKNGRIYVNVEESVRGDAVGTFTFHMRGLDIKNVESGPLGLGRSDPFYEIAKKNADHDKGIVRWNTVYRSPTILNNLNPFFDLHVMSLEELCYCDLDWPLRITIFDWQGNGKHRIIGMIETTVRNLQERISVHGNADREHAYELFKENRTTKRGLVVILKANVNLD
jgi:Ca2+-dependent lipid-binding protein